jgi:hypothetical protein
MRIRIAPGLLVGVSCLVGSLVAAPSPSRAQTTVRGVVVDSSDKPVSEVTLAIIAIHQATRTDDHGHFVLPGVPKGPVDISVRRIGYQPLVVQFVVSGSAADSIRVVLNEVPEVLAAVAVSAAERHRRQRVEDFYFRRARGIGTYFTREDILARRASVPSDILRTAKGIRFVRTATGNGIRFTSATSIRGGCVPTIWIDGQRAPAMEVDEIPLNDIEGIELYNGASTTPPEFWLGNTAQCGTIVVWSRVPGA